MISEHLHRTGDPETSIMAAQRATKASGKAIAAVRSIFRQESVLSDTEIRQTCRGLERPYLCSLSTIQHARLALTECGWLVDSGERHVTPDGCRSIAWKRAS